jgi:chromosome segregation ATPase
VASALAECKVHIAANDPGIPIYLVDVLALGETLVARQSLLNLHQRLKVYEEKLLRHQIALPSKLASKLAAYSAKLKHAREVEDSRKFTVNSGGKTVVKDINRARKAALQLEAQGTRVERQQLNAREASLERQNEFNKTQLRMAAVEFETERVRVERQQLVEGKAELERQYEFYKNKLLATYQRMKTCQTKSKEAGHCAKRNPVSFNKRRSDLQEHFKEDARVCGLK